MALVRWFGQEGGDEHKAEGRAKPQLVGGLASKAETGLLLDESPITRAATIPTRSPPTITMREITSSPDANTRAIRRQRCSRVLRRARSREGDYERRQARQRLDQAAGALEPLFPARAASRRKPSVALTGKPRGNIFLGKADLTCAGAAKGQQKICGDRAYSF